MKNSLLFALATGLVLSCTLGCRTPQRNTPLPDGSTSGLNGSRQRPPETLHTTPFNNPGDSGITAVTPANPGDLADDALLDGREQDRARYAGATVYFEFDRATVRPGEASKVAQVAGQFKTLGPDHDLLLEGHCDERGTEEYNRTLGERRALAIRELLIASGVDGARVHTKSFGEDRPAQVGHDEAAWSKNRRGEFILVLPKNFTTTQAE